jgi:all-trans-8'-apo-beta-carotenal 15,15'-oxygenase
MTSVDLRPTTSYRVTDWQRGYESLNTEYSYAIEDIEGEIPAELEGTLFRNGPGKLDVNGTPLQHPFDGDGMISGRQDFVSWGVWNSETWRVSSEHV